MWDYHVLRIAKSQQLKDLIDGKIYYKPGDDAFNTREDICEWFDLDGYEYDPEIEEEFDEMRLENDFWSYEEIVHVGGCLFDEIDGTDNCYMSIYIKDLEE